MTEPQLYAALREIGITVEDADEYAGATRSLSNKQRRIFMLWIYGNTCREISAAEKCAPVEIARIKNILITNR